MIKFFWWHDACDGRLGFKETDFENGALKNLTASK